MNWTYTQLIAMIFFLAIMAGVAFTAAAPAIGYAFVFCTFVLFCATLLAYLNGYRMNIIHP